MWKKYFYALGDGSAIIAVWHSPHGLLLNYFSWWLKLYFTCFAFNFSSFFFSFSFDFSSLFSEKAFPFYSSSHLTKQSAWCIKDVGCPFSFKNQGESRVLSFLPSLPCLLSWDEIKQSCFMSDRTSYMPVSQHPSCRDWINCFGGYLIMSALSTFKNAPDVLLQWDCLQNQL